MVGIAGQARNDGWGMVGIAGQARNDGIVHCSLFIIH
jgi:hypothetical protein